jgi:hypothetical protein
MGFKYPVRKHVRVGMTVQTFQNGILKMNHLLSDELLKKEGDMPMLGAIKDCMLA